MSQFPDSIISNVLTDTLGVYKGVIYENISAQLLNSLGIKCYYYEPNTSSEIDFVIEYNGGVTPIEVKGGFHTRSTSFAKFVKNHKCADAFRFSKKNVGISDDGVTKYLPVYSMEWTFENK